MMYIYFFKRFFDFLISVVVIIGFCWLFFMVAICLHFSNKGSGIFFFQTRVGRYGHLFKVVKFKTMTDVCDNEGKLLPDEKRITKIGSIIRSFSIDELPQFYNVMIGDMSLIGPRPLLVQYIPLYTKEQFRRHNVRPGITGWAQCHGRNSISWAEKFSLDVWYVDHCSFLVDLKIFWITVIKVISRSDISHEGSATMDFFDGTN